MAIIAIEEAQQNLVTLVKRALDGEEIVIEADSRKARLAPLPALPHIDAATARRRGFGSMKGQFEVTDAFFEPLPEGELKFWEGQVSSEGSARHACIALVAAWKPEAIVYRVDGSRRR